MIKFTLTTDNDIAAEIEGYAVRFNNTDLDNEYFTAKTFFGFAEKLPLYYDHTFNKEVEKLPIGEVLLEKRGDGIYAKGVISSKIVKDFFTDELEKAEKYIAMIKELGRMGKLGFSTGAASHTLVKNSNEIKQWLLAELSLTPTPADPDNIVATKKGREFSEKNRKKIKALKDKIAEINATIDEITKDFDEDNPSVIPQSNIIKITY
jgi:phage head maturation protease